MKLSFPSNKICPFCNTGGYVWYLNDSEYVAKCTNCGHYFHKEDFPLCVLDSIPKPKTNADDVKIEISDETIERCCRLIEVWLDGHPRDRIVCVVDVDEQRGVLRHRVNILRGKEEE